MRRPANPTSSGMPCGGAVSQEHREGEGRDHPVAPAPRGGLTVFPLGVRDHPLADGRDFAAVHLFPKARNPKPWPGA